jgi:hypothetical protein
MLSKSLFFTASFVTCLLLYLPALSGGPIWDDLAFWIHNPEMQLSYGSLWSGFSWPLSMSVQKAMLSTFGERYWLYHLTNLVLHFINSALVYGVAVSLGVTRARWLFLLFLFHPANVISVAWMIQIKTLICFLFAILAFAAFQKGPKDRRWLLAALLLFSLSLLAKASAIMLPLVLMIFAAPEARKKWLWGLPLLAVALIAAYFFWANPFTQKVSPSGLDKRWEEVGEIKKPQTPDTVLVAQTLRYYLGQSIAPVRNYPIKGRAEPALRWFDTLSLLVLAGFFVFFWRTRLAALLAAGIVMLIPFFGLIQAPYMTMTWVSDQHLYLALPLLLLFWLTVVEKLPRRAADSLLILLLGFFVWKAHEAVDYFRDEDRFYSASLISDPGNVTVAFNYASTLAYQDRTDEALAVAQAIYDRAEKFPVLRLVGQYVELERLRHQLIAFQEYKNSKPKN